MTLPSFPAMRYIALCALACGIAWAAVTPAPAQGLLIYGNFCGPGSRGPGYPPIDALDLACAHHDACSPEPASGVLPTCACNQRLRVEAGAVARSPLAPAQTRQTAQFISDFATALPCR